jgi:hypothetical protein
MSIKGFFRLQIVDPKTKKIRGDSGWRENVVTATGLNYCIGGCAVGRSDSSKALYLCLGTGSVPNFTDISLNGSTGSFVAFTTSNLGTSANTQTARMTCQFGSALLGASCNISQIGVFPTNSNASLIAGNSFASSQWNTNQDVNATYELRLSSS